MTITNSAVQAGTQVVVTGWTWAATMGLIQNILLAGGGTGLAGLIIRASLQLKRIANERAKQDGDRDSARWTELMDLNKRLGDRVDKLEKDGAEQRDKFAAEFERVRKSQAEEMERARTQHAEEMERVRVQHAEEVADIHRRHDATVQSMRAEINGIRAMALQNNQSQAALLLPPNTPKANEALERLDKVKGAGE